MDKISHHQKTAALRKTTAHLRHFFASLFARRPGRIQTAALCFTLLLVLPAAAFLRPAVRVTLDGRTIGYVDSAATLTQAVDTLQHSVSTLSGDAYALDGAVALSRSLTLVDQIADTEQTVAALADAANDVDMLAVLTVDGTPIGACASVDEVQSALDSLLARHKAAPQDSARFTEEVSITRTPAPADQLISTDALMQKLDTDGLLPVEVTGTVDYTEAIPHETTWVDNNDMDQNTTEIITPGEDGAAKIRAEVVTVNGVETQRTILSRAVLSPSKTEVVAVGTRNIGIGTGKMIAPLTSYRYTSAFKFRSGRWHKGVDLCTPVGTPVYAADNGKVIVSEWSDSFGNYIILDHQNGLKTLYAHNSDLLVSVGDVIAKGGQIALSGNTGRSSGPHVHFEVHQNGSAVNPQLYVALGPLTR